MKIFEIKKGTQVEVIKEGLEWWRDNFKKHVTGADHGFLLEEMIIDPVGNIGCTKRHKNVIGGLYAERGYYGFRRDGFCLVVPASKVTVK